MYAIIAYVTVINSVEYVSPMSPIPIKKTSVSSMNSVLAPLAVESLRVGYVGIGVK